MVVEVQKARHKAHGLLCRIYEVAQHLPGALGRDRVRIVMRTLIVNDGPWESREAVMAARKNPVVVGRMAQTEKVAGSSNSRPYVLRKSVSAARK